MLNEPISNNNTCALLLDTLELLRVTAALSNENAAPPFAAVLLSNHELSTTQSLTLHV